MEKINLYKVTFSVSVKEYIYKYLIKTYGEKCFNIGYAASPVAIAILSNLQKGKTLKKGNIIINTEIKNKGKYFITNAGENKINSLFNCEFKKTFREFMTGALSCNQNLTIKEAITCFCRYYDINLTASLCELLRKDWYRYLNFEKPEGMALFMKQNIY